MALTHFYITNDLRTDLTNLPGLGSNILTGHYIYYDAVTGIFTDTTAIVDPAIDNIVSMSLWDTPKINTGDSLVDWEVDTSKLGLPGGTYVTNGLISDTMNSDKWREVLDHTDFNIKRNRSFTMLYNCVAKFQTDKIGCSCPSAEPIGYNTSIRLSNQGNSQVYYISDPILYEVYSTGIAYFYFSPQPKAGWFRCHIDEFYTRIAEKNPDYDKKLSTALSPCDADGWRTVINAAYYGEEHNFYPNGCTDWWKYIEGVGHNTKIRFLDSKCKPLPFSAWYPMSTIRSGIKGYTEIGTTLGPNGVSKVEIRYVDPPSWVVTPPPPPTPVLPTVVVSSSPSNNAVLSNLPSSINVVFSNNVTSSAGTIELTPTNNNFPDLIDVSVNSKEQIELTFDENIGYGSGSLELTPNPKLKVININADPTTQLEVSFNNTIKPVGELNYTIIEDNSTPDITGVSGSTTNIKLEFDENVLIGSGNITISPSNNVPDLTEITISTDSIELGFDETIKFGSGSISVDELHDDKISPTGTIDLDFETPIKFGSGDITIDEEK